MPRIASPSSPIIPPTSTLILSHKVINSLNAQSHHLHINHYHKSLQHHQTNQHQLQQQQQQIAHHQPPLREHTILVEHSVVNGGNGRVPSPATTIKDYAHIRNRNPAGALNKTNAINNNNNFTSSYRTAGIWRMC